MTDKKSPPNLRNAGTDQNCFNCEHSYISLVGEEQSRCIKYDIRVFVFQICSDFLLKKQKIRSNLLSKKQ